MRFDYNARLAVAQTPSSATGNTASPSQQPDVWHVKRLLEWTTAFFERKQVDSPRLSAEMLLAHVLELQRIELYTNFDRPLSPGELKQYRELVQRAANQEPVRYLTGTAPFYGLDFKVSAAVLIPRPDTETLVETVLHHQKLATDDAALASPRIADLCTGSGCIAIALAKHLTEAQIVAVEIDEAAADVAKQNAADLGVEDRVDVRLGDLLKPLAGEPPFTIITANPPYIPSAAIDQLDRNVRDYEPRLALDGGDDGLDLHRRLLADTPRHLVEGGRLYVEMQFDQGPALLDLAKQSGHWSDVQILKDLAGRDRVLMARR